MLFGSSLSRWKWKWTPHHTTIVQYHASLRSSTPTQPMFSRALTNRSEHVSAAAYSVWHCAMVLLYQMPAPSNSGYWMPSSSILSRCHPPLSWYNTCMRGQEMSFASSLTMIFIFVYLRGLIARFWQSLFSLLSQVLWVYLLQSPYLLVPNLLSIFSLRASIS